MNGEHWLSNGARIFSAILKPKSTFHFCKLAYKPDARAVNVEDVTLSHDISFRHFKTEEYSFIQIELEVTEAP